MLAYLRAAASIRSPFPQSSGFPQRTLGRAIRATDSGFSALARRSMSKCEAEEMETRDQQQHRERLHPCAAVISVIQPSRTSFSLEASWIENASSDSA